ncbi:hypothetical protein T492DRAFT_1085996 [Pavlovales sp. CCMP2436]|nr:hypothetical protein T492DRAFT_1085996 [Pavlovales sp. CCMP2436]
MMPQSHTTLAHNVMKSHIHILYLLNLSKLMYIIYTYLIRRIYLDFYFYLLSFIHIFYLLYPHVQ